MDSLKSRSIIQTAFALNYYPRKHIDAPTLSLLRQSIPVGGNRSDLSNPLINLLDGYLGITGQSITYLSLFKNTANELFSGFIGALLCETFVATSRSTRDNYVRTILKTLKAMSFDIPNLTSDIDQRHCSNSLERDADLTPFSASITKGGVLNLRQVKEGGLRIKLAWVWNNLGPEVARALHKAANDFTQRYERKSQHIFSSGFE